MNRFLVQDDDESPFDDRGLLRDGHRLRVPTMLMDSLDPLQRSVMRDGVRVTDAFGGDSMGSRPGYRFLGVEDGSGSAADALAHHRRVARAEMYRRADEISSRAWRGEDADEDDNPPVGAGEHEANYAGRVGDPCTCRGGDPEEGALGTLVKGKNGELFCRPIRAADSVIDHRGNRSEERIRAVEQQIYDHQTNMARIYAEVEAEISRAWRQT